LLEDERFTTNEKRVGHRGQLIPLLEEVLKKKPTTYWQKVCNENNIPCGPINNLEQLFQDPQVKARQMLVTVEHPKAGNIDLVGSPLKFSKTSITIRHHPPMPGEHTEIILKDLEYSREDIIHFKKNKII
jgi:crotonobetainyl-CoA:carnitine CoA-transferase CaiB-like acyl-CoA transferase